MIHVGFTGTRHGMSTEQRYGIDWVVAKLDGEVTAHHGCCVGADEQFHEIAVVRGCTVIGHPGPDWPEGPLCAYTICGRLEQPLSHMRRNAAIVAVSQIMIAAPYEDAPQLRGGTWATIRMALRALRAGKLRELHVVGRDGRMLEHGGWR